MLMKHAELAEQLGIRRGNIFVAEIGSVIEFSHEGAKFADKVPSGHVLIDGLGVGDVGNIVLRDRKQLSQDGILIVVLTLSGATGAVIAGPDIVTRGFVYVRESETMLNEIREITRKTMLRCEQNNIREWTALKSQIRDVLSKYLYEKTKRRPMIMPILQEVK